MLPSRAAGQERHEGKVDAVIPYARLPALAIGPVLVFVVHASSGMKLTISDSSKPMEREARP